MFHRLTLAIVLAVVLSLVGVTAVLASTPPPPPGGDFSHGYWKNHQSEWPAPYDPGDDYDTTFGVDLFDPDITLLDALKAKGKGSEQIRNSVADLLNAAWTP